MDANPRIESNYNSLDLYKIGAQTITYELYDESGNKASKTVIVILIILVIIGLIYVIFKDDEEDKVIDIKEI